MSSDDASLGDWADPLPTGPAQASGPGPVMVYTEDYGFLRVQVDKELDQAAHKVHEYLSAHEDVFAGGHFSPDYSQYSVSVAKPDDPAVNGLLELIATLGPAQSGITFGVVERSYAELDEIRMAIINDYVIDGPTSRMRKGSRIQELGLRDSPSRVTVGILWDQNGRLLEECPEVQAINARFPGAVMFTEVYSTVDFTSR